MIEEEELSQVSEAKPLRPSKPRASYGGTKDEEDWMATGFTVQEISPQVMRLWLFLQVLGLLFEFNLYREVSSHLRDFEAVVARECADPRRFHGVCVGPSWNTSIFQDFVLHGHDTHNFRFSTSSQPPTFLLAVHPGEVEPKALGSTAPGTWEDDPERKVRWSLEVQRLDPAQALQPLKFMRSGAQVITAEDLSEEVTRVPRVQWQATVRSIGFYRQSVRFVAFVEDAVREQLVAIHQHPRCSFSVSWKAFNQQHQGQSHLALSRCESLLGVFLVVGSAAVCLVHRELEATSPKSRRFHLVVLAKFILQDVPQQICFVLYLFGWYEAGGLRCQLCLFDAEHCSDEDAFHFSNVVVVGLILVSSLANQLLIRPVRKRRYTEDDVCMHMWIRVGGTCVATLPFTTGLCLSSRSLISQPTLTHVLFAAPCLLGWLSITGFCCLGILLACDEDFD